MVSLSKSSLKEISNIAVPASVEKSLLLLTSMISTIIVGRINSDTLVAVSMCNTLYTALQAIFIGLSIGATVHIARQYGVKDIEAAESTMFYIVMINAVIGVILSIILWIFGKDIICLLFNQLDDNVIKLALLFLKITLVSLPFMGIDFAISASLRGAGNAKLPLKLTLIVNVINIALAYFSVYVLGYGISGVAFAFLISRCLGGVIRLILVLNKRFDLELHIRKLHKFSIDKFTAIFSCGSVTMFEKFAIDMCFLGMTVITSHISKEAVGAYQLANNGLNIVYAITFGLENSAITVVGSYLGKKDLKMAKISAGNIFFVTEAITCFIGLIFFIFAKPFISIFSTDNDMIKEGIKMLRLMVFTIPLTSIFQAITGTLKTGGKAIYVMIFGIASPWLVRIPTAYLLCVKCNLGIYGLVIGFASDYVVRSTAYMISYFRKSWLTAKVRL